MTLAVTGVHVLSGLIGSKLILGSVSLWLAHIIPPLRRKIEHVFLRDQYLFAKNKSYTTKVALLKWLGFIPGGFLVLPRFVLYDILIVVAIWALWVFLNNQVRRGLSKPEGGN